MEDRYSTATHAYCNVFRIAREVLGPDAYLQERLGIGSDATLGFVSSVRTEGDNNILTPSGIRTASLRWYKNRILVNYDMDGKALVEAGHGEHRYKIGPLQRRTILTLSYAISGRLLLTESFSRFSPEIIYELGRVYPFHSTELSARPLDAFIRKVPSVFNFNISPGWHQLVLYNGEEESKEMSVSLSGNTASGALGLDPDESYYLYDFWNDRHVMQGYVDLVRKPQWDATAGTLTGISALIGEETYTVTIALNGFKPKEVKATGAEAELENHADHPDLADLQLKVSENQDLSWSISF